MKRKLQSKTARVNRRTFTAGLSAAGLLAGTAPFNIVRAQGSALKVGVLLPRSGYQAGIGQDCQRGVDITAGILKVRIALNRLIEVLDGAVVLAFVVVDEAATVEGFVGGAYGIWVDFDGLI